VRKYTCPCCGYKTLAEGTRDSYEICTVCYWEDDFVQNEDPDFEGGANEVSLRQAQRNFKIYGASEEMFKDSVIEPSLGGYLKDENFKPL
jgi:Cysteine-rich CPCC